MIVYVDVLIFTNIVIDYLLLSITAFTIKTNPKLIQLILASFIGGVLSLYIFVDSKSIIFDFIFKITSAILLTIVSFGFTRLRIFIIRVVVFMMYSFTYNGIILFLYNLKSSIFLSNNFVSYIKISPIILVLLSSMFYIIIRIVDKILHRQIRVEYVYLELKIHQISIELKALVDSGHSLIDPFSNSQVIVVDEKIYNRFKDNLSDFSSRVRLIPVSTISESSLIEGIRCDKAIIKIDKEYIELYKPIVIASFKKINDSCNSIISKSAVEVLM